MALIRVVPAASAHLDEMIEVLTLPDDTRDRVRNSLGPIATFPHSGQALPDDARGRRYIGGPWPWMLIVYRYDADRDTVVVLAIEDRRQATTSLGPAGGR